MKKTGLTILGVAIGLFLFLSLSLSGKVYAEGEEEQPIITDAQKSVIVNHCETIKDNLKSLQRTDSRTRVYLGRYYETILTGFIIPLNLRLVENNISNSALLSNQTDFVARRERFVNDYIGYQQALEDLVNTNCKSEPERFYEKLLLTREKRQVVNRDVTRLREMADKQVKLVGELSDATK